MLLQDITIICMRNIFKTLKRAKTYEAEAAKYIVRSISVAGFRVGIFSYWELYFVIKVLIREVLYSTTQIAWKRFFILFLF